MNIVQVLLKVALLGSSWVLYLLIALSIISVGVVIERLIFFRRNNKKGGDALHRAFYDALRAGNETGATRMLRDSGTVEGSVVASALTFREGGATAFSDALEAELSRAKKTLEKGTTFLGTVGNNAPFVGLFGTVIGVIQAFHELGQASARAGAMGNVMAGIAEALVATGVGIFVAIPAVIAYNVSQQQIGEIERNTMSLGRLAAAWIGLKEAGGDLRGADDSAFAEDKEAEHAAVERGEAQPHLLRAKE
jgi:biopolymer transport protein ExbB/biopolymer transport protein TolQ